MGANTGTVYAGAAKLSTVPTAATGTGVMCLKKTINVMITDLISTA